MRSVNPWWKVEGEWPQDYAAWPQSPSPDVLAGSKLAQESHIAVGDQIEIGGKKLVSAAF